MTEMTFTTEQEFDLEREFEFPPLGANTTSVKDLKDIKMNAYLVRSTSHTPTVDSLSPECSLFLRTVFSLLIFCILITRLNDGSFDKGTLIRGNLCVSSLSPDASLSLMILKFPCPENMKLSTRKQLVEVANYKGHRTRVCL